MVKPPNRTFRWIQIAGPVEIMLVLAEFVLPGASWLLPLGGDHLYQIGVIFGGAAAADEIADRSE